MFSSSTWRCNHIVILVVFFWLLSLVLLKKQQHKANNQISEKHEWYTLLFVSSMRKTSSDSSSKSKISSFEKATIKSKFSKSTIQCVWQIFPNKPQISSNFFWNEYVDIHLQSNSNSSKLINKKGISHEQVSEAYS